MEYIGNADERNSHLRRVLGVAFGIAAVVGTCIGQGILRAPGVVAEGVHAPALILLLWIAGGLFSAIDAMSTVELASSIRQSGGPYAFAKAAFGRTAGLATGLADWLGYVGVGAFIAVVFGEYLHRLGIASGVPVPVIAVLVVLAVGVVQALGTRVAGWSQEAGSAIKAVLFLALIAALLLAPRGAPVTAAPPPELTLVGLIIAARAILGTYLGWNAAAYYAEEVTDPRRQIARATFSGIALVTVIYVLVNVALLQVLTPAEMAGSPLAAGDAARRVFGQHADTIVTALSLVSLFTILNMALMTLSRVLYVIARDADVPYLSRVAENGTPIVAACVMVVAEALLAIVGVYAVLLAFSTWLMTGVAATVNLAAIRMRRSKPALDRPYRMPLFPLPAIIALVVNATLLAAFLYESPLTVLRATALLAVVTGAVAIATRRSAGRPVKVAFDAGA